MATCVEKESRRCAFFLQKKGRYCRMDAVKGSSYCGEHMLIGDETKEGLVTRVIRLHYFELTTYIIYIASRT